MANAHRLVLDRAFSFLFGHRHYVARALADDGCWYSFNDSYVSVRSFGRAKSYSWVD